MRAISLTFFTVLLLFFVFAFFVFSPVQAQVNSCKQGDANGDGVVTLGDYAVWRSVFLGAQPTARPTTNPTIGQPTPDPTAGPNPTTAPGSSTTCPLPKYPNDSCTGVPAGTTLTTVNGGMTVTTAGTVIDGKRITGDVDIRAPNVVIKNSEILGHIANDNGSGTNNFTIMDSTVGPTTCSSWGNGGIGIRDYTARRVRLRNFPDGFRVAGSNITIEDSYVTLCSANCYDHSDGIQAYGASNGTNIMIRHNAIDQTKVPSCAQTSPIFIPNDGAQQGNQNVTVSVVDNVLAGGGYALRIFGDLPFSAPTVTGNKIVDKSWGYGPLDVTCSKIGTWSGNAVVTYNWQTGTILSEVKALNDCQ